MLGSSTNAYPHSNLERALSGISKAGFKYVEIAAIPGYTQHLIPEKMSKRDYEKLNEILTRYGLKTISVSGHIILALAGDDLLQPNASKAIELTKNRIDLAAKLGAEVLNTVAGDPKNKEEEERFYENIRLIGDYAKSRAVIVALESHGGMTSTGKKCLPVIKKINHDHVKINYDTANVRFYEGVNPEEDLDTIIPYVGHIHLKDHKGSKGDYNFPTIGDGDINWNKIFEIIDKHNFKGPFTAEIELQGPKVKIEEFIIDEAQKKSHEFLKRFELDL